MLDAVAGMLPFTDPIIIFAIAMVVFLGAPLAFERYRLPGIIGIIVMGTLIGPHGLGILDRTETFVVLGEVGLVYLMFLAGLEIDLEGFIAKRNQSAVFGACSFLIPQGVGMAVGLWVFDFNLATAALFGAIFSSHTLLAYPVVTKLDIVENNAVTTTLGGTIITDTAALLVLAVVAGSVEGELTVTFWATLGTGLVLLFLGVWVLVPLIGQWFFANVRSESYFEFLFVMAILFMVAVAAETAGVKHIIGAFLAGLALNRLIPSTGTLMNRIEFVGNALFIPFFLFSVGMLVNPGVIVEGGETITFAIAIIVLLLGTKLIASAITGTIYGFERAEQATMFGLSTGQAAAALAITIIGFEELEIFGEAMVNAVVLMILVVSIISPALTKRYGNQLMAEEPGGDPDETAGPTRVLVPVSGRTEAVEHLLDFAVLVRETAADAEPLRLLTVITRKPTRLRGAGDSYQAETARAVATAEEDLEAAEEHVAGAEVPVETLTRVDTNVVSGILRTITEARITTVIVGWPGERRFGARLFGDVVERLLRRTEELVLVSRIREPLNLTERVVCVLPARIAAVPGFYGAIAVTKIVTNEIGVSVHWYIVGGDPDRYERLIEGVGPDTSGEIDVLPVGNGFEQALAGAVNEHDLLVGISPRKDSRAWESRLDAFPGQLRRAGAENVVVAYPAEQSLAGRRQSLGIS